MEILNTYLTLKDNPNMDFIPRTYIFGAKAAPGYFLAKQTIKFLCSLRDLIDADPVVSKKMKMVYLEEYNVTMSEMLCPAADISQQISLAGTEASGTGNMKLMLSGAVTMGTLDGANIEIAQAAGMENEIIFGMTTPEVEALKRSGYNPTLIYENNDRLRRCVNFLTGTPGFGPFNDLGNSLHYNDPYMVLADFEAYRAARAKSAELYKQPEVWQKMSLMNVASSGIFCADRAVEEYARNIWNLK
jgi:starch phosphorylase